MERLLELKREMDDHAREMRSLRDLMAKEGRNLTTEEMERFRAAEEAYTGAKAQYEVHARVNGLEDEMRAFEAHKPNPQDTGRETRGTPRTTEEYRKAYRQYLKFGRSGIGGEEIRALQVGTDTEGGYLVPDEFERMLIEKLRDQNVMRTLATVITSASGDKNIPVVTNHGSAAWIDEEGAYGESDEEFGKATLSAWKVGRIIKVSEELLYDAFFNLEGYLASEFARCIGVAEEVAFINGDGVKKPTGVMGSAEIGVTAASAAAITADELVDVFYSLRRPYRRRATWLMADSTAKVIRKLKDGDGQYIWQPGLQAGQPDRLLGRPVEISDDVPAIAASARVIALGDFSFYWISDREGTVFQRLNELYAVNGQVGFKGRRRVDGKLTLAEAVKVLKMASS